MNSEKPFYGLANFKEGEEVRIADRDALDEFTATWKFHHKLESAQLGYSSRIAKVTKVIMYHGGDILYELENVPSLWHQRVLTSI